MEAGACWAACDRTAATASCASRIATTPASTTCGRPSPIRTGWPAGTARSRAISVPAASSGCGLRDRAGRRRAGGGVRAAAAPAGADQGGGRALRGGAEATLTADGDQTVLVIEARGMPLDKVAFYGAGWQIHGEDLAAYLADRELADFGTRFGELVTPYQELEPSWPSRPAGIRPGSGSPYPAGSAGTGAATAPAPACGGAGPDRRGGSCSRSRRPGPRPPGAAGAG